MKKSFMPDSSGKKTYLCNKCKKKFFSSGNFLGLSLPLKNPRCPDCGGRDVTNMDIMMRR